MTMCPTPSSQNYEMINTRENDVDWTPIFPHSLMIRREPARSARRRCTLSRDEFNEEISDDQQ